MERILFSIIIPIYNSEKYLKECLNSISKQTFQNFEVILIDDGSTDRSPFILKEYQRRFPNKFQVFTQENSGVAEARNYGIQKSRGQYLVFIDSDDYIAVNHLELLSVTLSKNNYISVFNDIYISFSNGNEKVKKLSNNDVTEMELKEAIRSSLDNNGHKGWLFNKVFLRENILKSKVKFNKEIYYGEDLLFVVDYFYSFIGELTSKVAVLHFPTYYYRHNSESATQSFSLKSLTMYKAADLLSKKVSEDFSKEMEVHHNSRLASIILNYRKLKIKKLSDDFLETEMKKIIEHLFSSIHTILFKKNSLSLKDKIVTIGVLLVYRNK